MTANTNTTAAAAGYVVHVEGVIFSHGKTEDEAAQKYSEDAGRKVRYENWSWQMDLYDNGEVWETFNVTECTPRFYALLETRAIIDDWDHSGYLIDILEVEEEEEDDFSGILDDEEL